VTVPALPFRIRTVLIAIGIITVPLCAKPQTSPDLSVLSPVEQRSIESACSYAETMEGPAAYNRCLQSKLNDWSRGPRRPDLSTLSPVEQRSVESACSYAETMEGPAAYNRCLQRQIQALNEAGEITAGNTPQSTVAKGMSADVEGGNSQVSLKGNASNAARPTLSTRQNPTARSSQSTPLRSPAPTSDVSVTPPAQTPANSYPSDPTGMVVSIVGLLSFVSLILWARYQKKKCPRCRVRVTVPGVRCSQCDAALKEESARAETRRQKAQRAYQATQEAERRRVEQEQEARRQRLRTLEQLQLLTGPEFENLIASLFIKDGYRVRQCGGSGDEGIDLVLEISATKDVVQCKRWKSDVGSPVVREFYGSMMHAFARHGFLITTAQFSESARAFVRGKPITLISGRDLIGWIDSRYSARRTAENSERDIRTPARPPLFDPFSVLGLHQGATRDQIRAAYRREMANYHPDKVAHLGQDLQELAKRRAQDINRAYEELLREG